MPSLGREQLFHRIIVFFAVFTAVTGCVNMASEGSLTFENIGSTGTITGQVYVDPSSSSSATSAFNSSYTISGVDFTSGTDYSAIIGTYGYGTWTNSTDGLELTSVSVANFFADQRPSVIIKGIVPDENVYTVDTVVDNVPDGTFYIYPRFWTGTSAPGHASTLRLKFDSEGIHQQRIGALGWYDDYMYDMENAQTTLSGGSTIHTVLTEATSTDGTSNLQVCKDDNCYFYIDVPNQFQYSESSVTNPTYAYGGAGSESPGFIIKSFPTVTVSVSTASISSTGYGFLDALISAYNALENMVELVVTFFGSLGAILGMSQDALIPFWLWAIVAFPCMITIVYMFVETVVEAIP